MTDPFAAFRSEIRTQTPLRAAITAAYRRPEPECVPPLLDLAALPPDEAERVETLARTLVTRLRAKTRSSGVEGLIHEYSLSSQEGVALMCLAEALLRIPDATTWRRSASTPNLPAGTASASSSRLMVSAAPSSSTGSSTSHAAPSGG